MQKSISQKLSFLLLLSLIFFLSFYPSKIQATENILFEDNFENGKKEEWEEYIGPGGSWTIQDGEYIGTVVKDCSGDFPSYALVGNLDWSNYTVEARVKGTVGVDKKILFRYHSNMEKSYEVNLISNNLLALGKYHPSGNWVKTVPFNNSSNVWYKIKIVLNNENIKIYVDDILQLDFDDIDNPILDGKAGFQIWPGYYAGCGGRTTVHYDDIIIKGDFPSPTPTATATPTPTITPTPTPTPIILQPLILLPGFGGSWNHENMILGIEKPQSEWYMTPGVKVYDGLIETLKNAGYETEGEDRNFFIFNYNWTKPVNSITEDLKTYIENIVKPSSEGKIDLLGHSLGGLVARTYVQKNQENIIDQLITVGSPHQGIPSVYYLWEGGDLSKFLPGWQKIGANLLLYLRKPYFATNMQAIREIVPSLKDLLPTFNYLKNGSQEINFDSMDQKNNWLNTLNNSLPEHLVSIFTPLIGKIPASTLRWINIDSPNWLDKILGLWLDGKPQSEEFADGDGTVLIESASLNEIDAINLEDLGHQELIISNEGQEKIMEVLGLNPTSISDISTDSDYNSSLVFQIASPATINITDPNGNLVGEGDGKLMIIGNPLPGEYQINLTGTTDGIYDLYIGQIFDDEDFWTTTSGLINEGDEISYKINFDPSAPLENPVIDQTGDTYIETSQGQISNLKEEIKQQPLHRFIKRLILIQLKHTEFLLKKGRFEKTITSLYRFRFTISFWQKTAKSDKDKSFYFKNKIQEIIDNLEKVYIISKTNKGKTYNRRRLKREITLAQRIFEKMEDNLQKLSKKDIVNPDYGALYLLSQTKLNKAKDSTSYEAHINALGVRFLSQEGLFLFR